MEIGMELIDLLSVKFREVFIYSLHPYWDVKPHFYFRERHNLKPEYVLELERDNLTDKC